MPFGLAVAATGFAYFIQRTAPRLAWLRFGGSDWPCPTQLGHSAWLAHRASHLVGGHHNWLFGLFFARKFQSPTAIFTVPAVIPMVPGTFAFRTMLGILEITNMGVFGSTPVLVGSGLNAVKPG
ncbi:MAG: threonine/serine exporter family protein [Ardenticatenaceae bacterium]|nr:threonine/serine exporter family protein [Ardenticatenaceae bacterium]